MPIPTTSPDRMDAGSTGSSVSSTSRGSPHLTPVAAASTYSHRGVMTATPNETSLGVIKWTRGWSGIVRTADVTPLWSGLDMSPLKIFVLHDRPRSTERNHDSDNGLRPRPELLCSWEGGPTPRGAFGGLTVPR